MKILFLFIKKFKIQSRNQDNNDHDSDFYPVGNAHCCKPHCHLFNCEPDWAHNPSTDTDVAPYENTHCCRKTLLLYFILF